MRGTCDEVGMYIHGQSQECFIDQTFILHCQNKGRPPDTNLRRPTRLKVLTLAFTSKIAATYVTISSTRRRFAHLQFSSASSIHGRLPPAADLARPAVG